MTIQEYLDEKHFTYMDFRYTYDRTLQGKITYENSNLYVIQWSDGTTSATTDVNAIYERFELINAKFLDGTKVSENILEKYPEELI